MRVVVVSFVVLLNFILQSTLFQYIEIVGVKPNTAILIIISYAMLRGDISGAVIGFFSGLLLDIAFFKIVGFNAMFYSLIGFFCAKPFKDFVHENYILPVVLTIAAMLSYEYIFYVCNFLLKGQLGFSYYFSRVILPETVYTMALCIPVYFIVYKINQKLEDRERIKQSIF